MSFGRKFKKQQQQKQSAPTVFKAPIAKPISPAQMQVYQTIREAGLEGFNNGFDQGYRKCMAYIIVAVGWVMKYHWHALQNPSTRQKVLFDMVIEILNEYTGENTPKSLALLDEFERLGIEVKNFVPKGRVKYDD